ncbi:MAG: T9SS type A sorting domain-containing protein [Chitinophagaceae bacterium]|nr:T9SS type A sorting domain-containing protein [Chitinophagaceae bacterium]
MKWKKAPGLGIGASISDNVVKLVKGGSIGGTNHASGASWTSSDSYFTYGSSSDLWGLTWTPADVNGAGFGVAVSATTSTGLVSLLLSAQVDHIRITVYYSVPLPVTFRNFFAIPDQSAMKLKWSTASEANSVRFVAEKYSEINAEWIPVDSVIAAGNSSIEKKYEAFDKSPGDLNIYRIRQVDMDGRFMFSKTITAGFHTRGITRVKIFPNPVQDKIQINSPDPLLHVKMLSVEGKEMFNLIPGTGCRNITIPVENMLPGLYFLQIQTSLGTDVEKIVHH